MTVSELIQHLSKLDPNMQIVRMVESRLWGDGYMVLDADDIVVEPWDGKFADKQFHPPQTVCAFQAPISIDMRSEYD